MKLALRKPKLSDLSDFRNVFNDKKVTSKLAGYPYPLTLEKAKKRLNEIIKKNNSKKKDYYEFAIITNGKFAGLIALENPSKNKKTFSLGYAIGSKCWNKGITTLAIKKILNFGFKKLKLKKIIADNDESNTASGKVLENNGFKFLKRVKKKKANLKKKVGILYWEKTR